MLEAGVQPVAFVHDLQNHDEITYQLAEPEGRKDETFAVGGRKLTGRQLKDEMLAAMRSKAAGRRGPVQPPVPAGEGRAGDHVRRVRRPGPRGQGPVLGHAGAGASRSPAGTCCWPRRTPCSRACSACRAGTWSGPCRCRWRRSKDRVGGGDYRWVNRGGVDLMGANPTATASAFGLPRAKALYGPLPGPAEGPGVVRLPAEGAARGPQEVPGGGGRTARRPGAEGGRAVRPGAEAARPPAGRHGAELRPRGRRRRRSTSGRRGRTPPASGWTS